MAGRPRTKLKAVEELVQRADIYGNDLYELMPAQYLDQSHQRGPTSDAWNAALRAAAQNLHQIRELLNLIAQKAARAEQLAASRIP